MIKDCNCTMKTGDAVGYHDLPDHASKLLMYDLLIKRRAVIRCWGFNIRLSIDKAGIVTGYLEDTT